MFLPTIYSAGDYLFGCCCCWLLIIWVCCRASKSMPGAAIFPLCLHFYWLCPGWQNLSNSQSQRGVRCCLCQTTPNPLHFGGYNTLRCPNAYKPRDGKVFDRGERSLSVSFAAQIPSWSTVLLCSPFLWRHYPPSSSLFMLLLWSMK